MVQGKSADKRAKLRETAEYTEEILVTRADLEARGKQMQQLKSRVDELVLNNDYHLRLKDMNHKEKIKEVSYRDVVSVFCVCDSTCNT